MLEPMLLRGPRVGAPIVQCFFDALAYRIGAHAVFYGRDVNPDALARAPGRKQRFADRRLFLTKHLLLDYRCGERYFEQHLADADLAANSGG